METIYDWLSLAMFGALVVLFLERSAAPDPPDTVWHYLPPAIGCALVNYFGNEGQAVLAILIGAVTVGYVVLVLKPRFGQ